MRNTFLKEIVIGFLAVGAGFLVTASGCVQNRPDSPGPTGRPLADSAASILAEAIQFHTVNPPGDEAPLAAFLVGLLRRAGVEAALVETPRGESRVGRAAAWGMLRGTGERAALVLLAHLDTVPVDAERWREAPFAGAVRDGYVIGRGAQDAKGVAVIQLMALLELARRDTPLARDVIFLATPDEESGGRDGAGWLVRERRSLLRGAAFLLTEGGGVLQGPHGAPTWQVAVTEKSPCWLRITATGPPGHSSVPTGADAVPRLLDALTAVRQLESKVHVTPSVQRMFASLAPAAPRSDRRAFANLTRALERDPAFRQRFLAQPAYAALVRDTTSLTVLEGGKRTNVLPAEAVAHLDARLLPGASCANFTARVRRQLHAPGVAVATLLSFPSASSPVDSALYRAIVSVAGRLDPGAIVVPRVNAGFTDAHWFREIGLEAYGFVPRWHQLGESRGVHGPNERISVENLERGVATLVEIIEELDRQDPPDVSRGADS
jgi:acetylornithine deacetylase/succinyl-diaminopimelate desuccinylase-like protein